MFLLVWKTRFGCPILRNSWQPRSIRVCCSADRKWMLVQSTVIWWARRWSWTRLIKSSRRLKRLKKAFWDSRWLIQYCSTGPRPWKISPRKMRAVLFYFQISIKHKYPQESMSKVKTFNWAASQLWRGNRRKCWIRTRHHHLLLPSLFSRSLRECHIQHILIQACNNSLKSERSQHLWTHPWHSRQKKNQSRQKASIRFLNLRKNQKRRCLSQSSQQMRRLNQANETACPI